MYISSVVSERNAAASPLCTRAEDQSSWAGSPSINYAANCLTGLLVHSSSFNKYFQLLLVMILEFFQGSVGKTGTDLFSDPFQMSLFVCDLEGSIFPAKPDYFIILQNSLSFLLIRISLFPKTAKDLISLLCFFCHFSGIWGENVIVYICHVDVEPCFFIIYNSYWEYLQKVHVGCCIFGILTFQRMFSTPSHKQ